MDEQRSAHITDHYQTAIDTCEGDIAAIHEKLNAADESEVGLMRQRYAGTLDMLNRELRRLKSEYADIKSKF